MDLNSDIWILILIFVAFIISFFLIMKYLWKSNDKVLQSHEELKNKIHAVSNWEQYHNVWDVVLEWNRLCWNKTHNSLMNEILTMMETKKSELLKNK